MSHDERPEEDKARRDTQQVSGDFAAASPESARLTPRELQVLRLLADGRSNKEIAWQLRVTVHMVKAHVSRVLEKLHVASRTEAAVFYIRAGWDRAAPGSKEAQDEEGPEGTVKGA